MFFSRGSSWKPSRWANANPTTEVMWTSQGDSVDSEGGFGWVDGCGSDVGFGFVQPQVAGVGRLPGSDRAGGDLVGGGQVRPEIAYRAGRNFGLANCSSMKVKHWKYAHSGRAGGRCGYPAPSQPLRLLVADRGRPPVGPAAHQERLDAVHPGRVHIEHGECVQARQCGLRVGVVGQPDRLE